MISWDLRLAEPVVKQEFKRPVVYLDHWAIRKISASPELATRFVTALKAKHGTWAVSLLNLMEFIEITDERQGVQFEELLDRVLPNLFFLDFQAFEVIARERAMLQGGSRNAPYGDVYLLEMFAEVRPDTPRPFTAKKLVTTIVSGREQLVPGLARFKETIVERIQGMREQLRCDSDFEKRVRGSQEVAKNLRTWLFVRELIGTLLLDRNKVILENDAMDLLHTVVPVAYCDCVLLDSGWKHRVDVVRDRLAAQNIGIKPADVFSGKRKGLEQFFRWLQGSPIT